MRDVVRVVEAIGFFLRCGASGGDGVVDVHEERAAVEMLHAEVVDVRRRKRFEIFEDDAVVRERRGAEVGDDFVERVARE